MKKKKINKSTLYLLAGIILLGISVYLLIFFNHEAWKRQHTEEDIADNYINDIVSGSLTESKDTNNIIKSDEDEAETAVIAEVHKETEYVDEEGNKRHEVILTYSFTDGNYFTDRTGQTYTPDYAAGSFFCVLEYPKLNIRRGVYQGTVEENQKNQDMWIPNLANLLQNFNYTQVTIEAHNHMEQDLSFNRLKEAQLGDAFTLYGLEGVYEYRVIDIYAISRDDERRGLANDLNMGKDRCYLVTCGRDNFIVDKYKYYDASTSSLITYKEGSFSSRYNDFIIEAQLTKQYTLDDYAEMVIKDELQWKGENK